MRLKTSGIILLFAWGWLPPAAAVADSPDQYGGTRIAHYDGDGKLQRDTRPALTTTSGEQIGYRLRTEHSEEKTSYFFEFVHGNHVETIEEWDSEESEPTKLEPLAVRLTEDGECLGLANRTIVREDEIDVHRVMLLNRGSVDEPLTDGNWSTAVLLNGDDGPVAFGRGGSVIRQVTPDGQERSIANATRKDWGAARSKNGAYYITAYDFYRRKLDIYTARPDDWDWKHIPAGQKESGWQHTLAMHDGRLYVLYYYFRNAFNRGLRMAVIGDGELRANYIYDRSRRQNLG